MQVPCSYNKYSLGAAELRHISGQSFSVARAAVPGFEPTPKLRLSRHHRRHTRDKTTPDRSLRTSHNTILRRSKLTKHSWPSSAMMQRRGARGPLPQLHPYLHSTLTTQGHREEHTGSFDIFSSRMGGTTLVPFRSVPTAELNLKLRKHSGDVAGSLSSSTLCFVRHTRTEAEVETNFFGLLEV